VSASAVNVDDVAVVVSLVRRSGASVVMPSSELTVVAVVVGVDSVVLVSSFILCVLIRLYG